MASIKLRMVAGAVFACTAGRLLAGQSVLVNEEDKDKFLERTTVRSNQTVKQFEVDTSDNPVSLDLTRRGKSVATTNEGTVEGDGKNEGDGGKGEDGAGDTKTTATTQRQKRTPTK